MSSVGNKPFTSYENSLHLCLRITGREILVLSRLVPRMESVWNMNGQAHDNMSASHWRCGNVNGMGTCTFSLACKECKMCWISVIKRGWTSRYDKRYSQAHQASQVNVWWCTSVFLAVFLVKNLYTAWKVSSVPQSSVRKTTDCYLDVIIYI